MHVDYYQGVESNRLVLGEFSSDELNSSFELSREAFVIFLDFVLLEAVLYLRCPVDLTALQDTLSGVF